MRAITTKMKKRIPIISIYGNKIKPSANDLSDVDVIVYDIQDVGARSYTYTSKLYYVIESAVQIIKSRFYVTVR